MPLNEWKETTIGEFCPFVYGKGLPERDRDSSGYIPVYGSNGIVGRHTKSHVNSSGIIIGRKGTIGSVNLSQEPFYPIDTSFYIEDKPEKRNLKFTYYLLKTLPLKMNNDSAVPGLNRDYAHNIKIKIPPLPEQKAIAEILGSLDDKIELNLQMNKTLEEIAQAIFKSWFVDFDPVKAKAEGRTIEGLSQEMLDLFPDSFEELELGDIPKRWRIATLEEAVELFIDYRGKTPKKLGGDWSVNGIPALSAKNIKTGRIVQKEAIKFVDKELFEKWMKDKLEIGDVLLTSEGPLGEVVHLTRNAHFCLSQRLFGLRPNKKLYTSTFLYYWLCSDFAQSEMEGRATGTTVVGIRQSELRQVRILLPPFEIQKEADKLLFSLLNKIALNQEENENLSNIRDSFLPKLISGEIRVGDAEKIAEAIL